MDKKFKNYVIYLSLLTAVLMVAYFLVKDRFSSSTAYIIPAFFLITLVTHVFMARAFSKNPQMFSMNFMAAMVIKMLASLGFLTAIYIAYDGITKDFVAAFMGIYLVYTVFEIVYLKPLAKNPDK